MTKKFHLLSLGCAKNLVDSEQMLARLLTAGYELVEDPDEADVAVVNTCSFIESAKTESIGHILELARSKETGVLKALVVAGCLAQRYRDEIAETLPEADGFVGCASHGDIVEVCDTLLANTARGERVPVSRFADVNTPLSEAPRVQTTPAYTAYIKIAEGCDNCCAYCVIPSLRGVYRSRRMEDITAEARVLAENGVKELIVVAQDITRYGTDNYGRPMLPALLNALCEIEELVWIRLHYLYPADISDELINTVAAQEKILPYIDMPLQHCSDRLLSAMGRRDTKAGITDTVRRLRKRIPGLVLRTTFITGLPGETPEEFAELCDFVAEMRFERVGVFPYSQEEGTAAAEMPDQVDEDEKRRRAEALMAVQDRVTEEYNAAQAGTTRRVLVEGHDRAAGCYFGRSYGESPDIDGKIFFMPPKKRPGEGDFVTLRITDSLDGDLLGELIEE